MSSKKTRERLTAYLDETYPALDRGKPHWATREKERKAYFYGYMKALEDIRRLPTYLLVEEPIKPESYR